MTNTKKITITTLATALILGGVYGAQQVKAAETTTTNNFPPVIQKLVEKFNLNPTEVKTVMDQERVEHQAEREADLTKKLDDLISSGKITADQKTAILKKHEELQAKREVAHGLSQEERRAKMQEIRSEMQNFLKEQGIDESILMPEGGRGKGFGGGGRGMHWQ